eukprot:TRINITY_DN1019_c4_g1_i1.p2 TRINITY_DN1019_c4_g1~~TRINITY_DN1019_c4_g1_i1.p2  ORF type:complete len:1073 (-),score=308.05 TRINITY_DN1019_c4_g1_i1:68-3286(-)
MSRFQRQRQALWLVVLVLASQPGQVAAKRAWASSFANKTASATTVETEAEVTFLTRDRRWPFVDHIWERIKCGNNKWNTDLNALADQQAGQLGALQQNTGILAENAGNVANAINANNANLNAIGAQVGQQQGAIGANLNGINQLGQGVAQNAQAIGQNAQNLANVANQLNGQQNHLQQGVNFINKLGQQAGQNSQLTGLNAQQLNGISQAAQAQANRIAAQANQLSQVGNQVANNAATIANNAQEVANLGQQVGLQAGGLANQAANIQAQANAAAQNAAAVANQGNVINQLGQQAAQQAQAVGQANQAIGGLGNAIAGVEGIAEQNAANIATNNAALGGVANQVSANANAIGHAGNVAAQNAAAIEANANAISNVAGQVATNNANIAVVAEGVAANGNAIGELASHAATNAQAIAQAGNHVAQDAAGIAANTNALSELSGNVLTNSKNIANLAESVGMLSGSVAMNSAELATLTAQVSVLKDVAAPTVALANMLGVEVGTVSSLALAGSFAGPLIGCIVLVFVCWPEPEKDPWFDMESRVSKMINDRFDKERRNRLKDRLKRYLETFSRCAHAWSMQAMPHDSAGIVSLLQSATRGEVEFDHAMARAHVKEEPDQSAPPCMSQLQGHMALERDEWMWDSEDSLSALFMPFANMHTQLLAALDDYPVKADYMQWGLLSRSRSAEYANFMLDKLFRAWKTHMCRSVRLRHSMHVGLGVSWKYQFITLSPVWQPHAGDSCLAECGGQAGWCGFCGGRDSGACCKRGADDDQDGICNQLDIPLTSGWSGDEHVCMHTGCFQDNTKYYYGEQVGEASEEPTSVLDCQEYCQFGLKGLDKPTHFNFVALDHWFIRRTYRCECMKTTADLKRYWEKNVVSGPVICPAKPEAKDDGGEEDIVNIPMEEIKPCDKSPPESNFGEVEEKHVEWVHGCLQNVSKSVAYEFNPFYKRFSKFVERLAWQAGCGDMMHDNGVQGWEEKDWISISDEFDFGTFGQCDWQTKNPERNEWQEDQLKTQGITGTSHITFEEQMQMRTQYALPKWLQRLRRMKTCLEKTAALGVPTGKDSMSSMQQIILSD